MSKIRILSNQVANQIAAGEVIERPAAVVKELIENSLDAGATKIEIEFKNGGKTYIRVEDNGYGMSAEETLLSLERHATSKLANIDDLMAIRTFGFRGEAVPSIASVSQFTIKTRRILDTVGTEIRIQAGKVMEKKEYGMAPGTRIEVEHLFASVAGRRAFLKTDNTEAAHIIHLCKLYAVSFSQVSFELLEDGQTIFKSPKCQRLQERVEEIWGWRLANELMVLEEASEGDLKLYGAIGKPTASRSTKLEIVTIINKRPVDSRALNGAILESYHTYIPKGRYPVAFLFLEINPAAVDVNVHPAKREVRFREEGKIRQFIIQSITRALQQETRQRLEGLIKPHVPKNISDAEKEALKASYKERAPINLGRETIKENIDSALASTKGDLNRAASPKIVPSPSLTPKMDVMRMEEALSLKKEPLVNQERHEDRELRAKEELSEGCLENLTKHSIVQVSEIEKQSQGLTKQKRQWDPLFLETARVEFHNWAYLGQIKGGYLVFRASGGVFILNPKAAVQRIRYEDIQNQLNTDAKMMKQDLLIPLHFEVNSIVDATLKECMHFLIQHGFSLELFGRHFYRIDSVPFWLESKAADVFLRDFLETVKDQSISPTRIQLLHELFAKMATKDMYDKVQKYSSSSAMQLVERLLACGQPMQCPNGKPTFLEWSYQDLERRFSGV